MASFKGGHGPLKDVVALRQVRCLQFTMYSYYKSIHRFYQADYFSFVISQLIQLIFIIYFIYLSLYTIKNIYKHFILNIFNLFII